MTKEQHWEHLRALFSILAANGQALNLEKCVFAVSEIDFLAHRISTAGVAPLCNNVQAILDLPTPTDCKTLQWLLGMVNFYFTDIYSREWPGSSSHSPLAGTPKVLTWLPTISIAFTAAKAALFATVLLAHPLP